MADIISFKQAVYTTDAAIVGTPTIIPGTEGFSISANLEGTGTPIVGLLNPGSFNATLSTVGVAFTYNNGLSGLARNTRIITLSSNTGVNTTFITRISSAFTCAALYKDYTSTIYTISANAALAPTSPLSATGPRGIDAVDPELRRLVSLGYI